MNNYRDMKIIKHKYDHNIVAFNVIGMYII